MVKDAKLISLETTPIENKLEIEKILKQLNNSIIEVNQCFKKDDFTGWMSHLIREMVFYFGIVNNFLYSVPEGYNTLEHYKYLIEKRVYFAKKISILDGLNLS